MHERVRNLHFCALSVCMSPTRLERDTLAWTAMVSRQCHDLNRNIATGQDQPETLHNPLVHLRWARYGDDPRACHYASWVQVQVYVTSVCGQVQPVD
jgi:hypothetical protein